VYNQSPPTLFVFDNTGSMISTYRPTVVVLGVFIDSDLSMQTHVQRTVSRCFNMLFCATCVSFGDKCSQVSCSSRWPLHFFSVGWTTVTTCWSDFRNISPSRLQSVQNTPAWLIFGIRRSEHITEASFVSWLRFCEHNLVQSRRSDLFTANTHHRVSLASPTCYLAKDSGSQLPTSYLYLRVFPPLLFGLVFTA